MTCHRIGCSPMGTIGLGRNSVSSLMRVPKPPHKIKTGMLAGSFMFKTMGHDKRRAGEVQLGQSGVEAGKGPDILVGCNVDARRRREWLALSGEGEAVSASKQCHGAGVATVRGSPSSDFWLNPGADFDYL